MTLREVLHGVWLGDRRIGLIHQRGDHTRFVFSEDYRGDPDRPVLGLHFEDERLTATHAASLRLPPWFSNLLPEGRIRDWVADDRGVSVDREMELLAHVGHDLPGAVRVLPAEISPEEALWVPSAAGSIARPSGDPADGHPGWRMSLAGVQLKFSVLADDDRLTLPASGEGGDWIVKLPDRQFANLPRNEYAMMSLAAAVGIDVPELRLVHRDQIAGLPPNVWTGGEEWAYAIRRFDRGPGRTLIHIEDLAQVRDFYADRKYSGNFETVAALLYRDTDLAALREFTRRLTFIVLISNGDAHLKNWSLIYRDARRPTLSPAYDLVSTAIYRAGPELEDLGLNFGGSRRFENVNLDTFRRLEERLGARGADLPRLVEEVVTRVHAEWPRVAEQHLSEMPDLRAYVADSTSRRGKTLLNSAHRETR